MKTFSARATLWASVAALLAVLVHHRAYYCPIGDSFRGKVVVITGVSSGIGVELARQFGQAGAKLVLAARRKAELEATAGIARAAGAQDVLVVPTDMTDSAGCVALIEAAASHFGGVDALVLNHALSEEYLVAEYNTTQDLDVSVGRTVTANLMGSAHATQAAIPYLERSSGPSRIVIVSSASAKTPAPFHAGYVASKRALHGYFDTLRHELHLLRSRVEVTILVLGLIATPAIIQDEGLSPLAMPVPACAHEMVCAIAAGFEESYVPKWYAALTPLLQLHSGFTEMLADANYVGQVPRYGERIKAARKLLDDKVREADEKVRAAGERRGA
jgi:NAD(P)-dependent dehydrogenase (short-subunit alcohol dehydrogenase family)